MTADVFAFVEKIEGQTYRFGGSIHVFCLFCDILKVCRFDTDFSDKHIFHGTFLPILNLHESGGFNYLNIFNISILLNQHFMPSLLQSKYN